MRTSFSHEPPSGPHVWQAVFRVLEQSIVPQALQTWILPLEFSQIEETPAGLSAKLVAPAEFSAQWVRDHYLKLIEGAFTQVTGAACEVRIEASKADPVLDYYQETAPAPERDSVVPAQPILQTGVRITGGAPAGQEHQVDAHYTFENFVVGASNQFAHASAVAVAEQPARQYNPLFLYSPPGLGKTHLLHAIGNHVIAKHGGRVAYLSAERFVNELIESLQHRRMPQFRTKYRDSYDLILIDDIQFIAGKNTSEEEFFHTFNALHGSKRQIVVTSDRPPKEIEGFDERIRTRFEWGLVADITPPEIETRIAILKSKAEDDDVYLPDEVATMLATYIRSNVRELEGVLTKLKAQASLTGAEISVEMARHELRNVIPSESTQYTVEAIQAAVAKHFQIRTQDLKATTRARKIAFPRQIAIYLVRKYTGMSYKEIGSHFGGKDHTTIIHACEKIEGDIEGNASVREAVEASQNLL